MRTNHAGTLSPPPVRKRRYEIQVKTLVCCSQSRENVAFGLEIPFWNAFEFCVWGENTIFECHQWVTDRWSISGFGSNLWKWQDSEVSIFWITELCPDAWEKVCGNVGKEMFLLWLQKILKCISCHAVYLRRTHYVHLVVKSMEWLHVVLPDCNYDGWTKMNKVVKITQRSWWPYLSHRSGGVFG